MQVLFMKNCLEFSEELERGFDIGDILEVLVNVVMKFRLNSGYIDVEFDEVSIKPIDGVFQELVILSLEEGLELIKLLEDWLNTFEVVLLKSLELLNSSKQLNELVDSSAEEIELTKDLVW